MRGGWGVFRMVLAHLEGGNTDAACLEHSYTPIYWFFKLCNLKIWNEKEVPTWWHKMEQQQWHLPRHALLTFSCIQVGVSCHRCHHQCHTLTWFCPYHTSPHSLPPLLSPSPSPFLPFPSAPPPLLLLPALALCFLALAAPAPTDDVAHLQVLGEKRLHLLHVVLVFNRVVYMVINGCRMQLTCNWGGGGEVNRVCDLLWLVCVGMARPEWLWYFIT